MADAIGAVQAAQADALEPPGVAELIDHWESHRPAWDVGGLYWRITRGTWPEQSAEYQRAQREAALQRERDQRRVEEDRRRRVADREHAAAELLEARAGPMLDALPAGDFQRLVERVFDEPLSRRIALRDRASPLTRPALLEAIDQTHSKETKCST